MNPTKWNEPSVGKIDLIHISKSFHTYQTALGYQWNSNTIFLVLQKVGWQNYTHFVDILLPSLKIADRTYWPTVQLLHPTFCNACASDDGLFNDGIFEFWMEIRTMGGFKRCLLSSSIHMGSSSESTASLRPWKLAGRWSGGPWMYVSKSTY